MKKIYFTILLAGAFIFNVKAQYVFNGCNTHYAYGDSLIGTTTLYDTTGIIPGSAGTNITWNFADLTVDTIELLSHYYYDPATTPGSSSFPGAGLADLTPAGQYTYSSYSPDSTTALGVWGVPLNCATELLSDPQKLTCPFSFGNSITDNYSGCSNCGANTIHGTRIYTYDGYGTLILPMATYTDVTRSKIVDSSSTGTASSVNTFYIWSDVNSGQPVFMWISMKSITYDFVFKFVQSFSYSHIPTIVTNVQSELANQQSGIIVYPNPFNVSTTIKINNENLKNQTFEFIMYNLLGCEIKHYQLTAGEKEFVIERNNLTEGMYFYKVVGKKEIIGTGKLIVN